MFRLLAMLILASLWVLGVGPGNVAELAAYQDETATEKKDNQEEKAETPETDEDESDSEEEEEEKVDPAIEAYQKLTSDRMTAQREFRSSSRDMDSAERMEKYFEIQNDFAKKFLEFAKEYAGSDKEFDAVMIAVQNGDDSTSAAGMEIMTNKFADDKRMVRMLSRFGRTVQFPEQKHEDFLKSLSAKSTLDEIKGGAVYALYEMQKNIPDMLQILKTQPALADQIPKNSLAFMKKDRPNSDAEFEKMLTELSEKYGDVKFGRSTLGKMAGDELFVFKHLSIGKEAPDIEGIDLDGEDFKLSDYRGKVVLLDFWGDW